MNTSEREQLSLFLQQLTQAQVGPKDEEAQGLINRAMGQQPDAAYLLVQRALLQDAALKVAQEKIAALQQALDGLQQPARGSGGFLDANAWGRAPAAASVPPPAPVAPGYGAPQAGVQAPPAHYPASAPAAPMAMAAAAPSPGFQAPSFLTGLATTAAGVAAGAFLFQGIGHLMGGHQNTGASAFGLSNPQPGVDASSVSNASNASGAAPQTEITNNYFDSPKADGADRSVDAASGADSFDSAGLDLDPSSDVSSDTSFDTSSDDWA